MRTHPNLLLPVIIFSQFAGTSLWFAGNAIITDIHPASQSGGLANITAVVQFGFIAGTLVFSLLTIADRFEAPKVFFFSSLIAATANLLVVLLGTELGWQYLLRFVTGFFLAGIYPVGMKIAADWFAARLGHALGFLVGALVLGTAFPHVLKTELQGFSWENVLLFTSALAFAGGLLILLLVPTKKGKGKTTIDLSASFSVFRSVNFRSAAFGYFGHMWELYTLWAFVPLVIAEHERLTGNNMNNGLWSFLIIAGGSIGCAVGGMISRRSGSKKVAFISLAISGLCCLLSPLIFAQSSPLFIAFMIIWGLSVVSDSPQFSSMVAQSAPVENRGTALTIVTCIGFAITIVSVQVLKILIDYMGIYAMMFLAAGPIIGLAVLRKYRKK